VKTLLLGILAVAALLAAGCPLLLEGGLIRLQIDTAAESRGIAVGDLEVTGLRIRVHDPAGEILETIDWDAAEGPRSYLVLVKQAGECEIEVTRFGEKEGEVVQAAESEVFEVQARRITIIDIVPGCIGVIHIQN
jgi:hypothetical protein